MFVFYTLNAVRFHSASAISITSRVCYKTYLKLKKMIDNLETDKLKGIVLILEFINKWQIHFLIIHLVKY